jgi:hypothetical protein
MFEVKAKKGVAWALVFVAAASTAVLIRDQIILLDTQRSYIKSVLTKSSAKGSVLDFIDITPDIPSSIGSGHPSWVTVLVVSLVCGTMLRTFCPEVNGLRELR